MHFADIERLLIRSIAESGEMYVRIIDQKFGKSKVPMGLQLIEGDQLCEDMNGKAVDSGNDIKMGVEVDKFGRPVAYWKYTYHPGDGITPNDAAKVRIPAEEISP